MIPIAWMAGASLVSWLVVSAVGGDRVNPEALFGLLGPLASACMTWMAVEWTWRSAPARLTGVMIVGFAIKLVFFGVYLGVCLRVLSLRPVPLASAFVSYFIALYAMQAFFMSRLITTAGVRRCEGAEVRR
jgi:hypothetical protein